MCNKTAMSSKDPIKADKPAKATPCPKKRQKQTKLKTRSLRFLLIGSLLLAVAVCSSIAYIALSSTEQGAFETTYESIAISALTGAKATTLRKLQGSEVMATMLSQIFPDAQDWPLISLDGYVPIANKVAQLSSSTVQSMTVIIDPNQTEAFEQHAKQVYIDQGRPKGAGHSDFGFGIWKPDKQNSPYPDGRSHDTTGETNWESSREDVMAPLLMHNIPNASALMYNLYSQANRGVHIQSIMDCVDEYDANANPNSESPACPVITDVLELKVRKGPAALLFQPIFPAHDPSTFVAFATTSIHWEEVLLSVVPTYVNGLTCVISTDTATNTYEIQNGYPEWVAEGDHHDPKFSHYGRSEILTDIPTGSNTSAVYHLTVYPTQVMVSSFTTNNPIIIALGFFGAIAFCTFIFFLYDFLMRRQATERNAILEMKRRFVRFISHEIRTPLNTVCMGLELLEAEMDHRSTIDDNESIDEEDVDFWHKVTSDVKENAHIAVSILNDLLNYDKLETGTLKLELGTINIWDLIERTVTQFQIQAVNRRIDVRLSIEGRNKSIDYSDRQNDDLEASISTSQALERLKTVGDDVRLSQVLRNVISNALKFTPAEGTIDITAQYKQDGLPRAPSLLDAKGKEACPHPRAGSVVIMVKDSGVGLSKDQLHSLFAEGVQFDANKLQHGGGSGLGLSIAKGIVEQHKGTIQADSQGTGFGTSFIVELPLYQFPPPKSAKGLNCNGSASECFTVTDTSATAATSVATQRESEILSCRRVLVAEDADSSRKMLIRLLERAGHTCVPAANGQEAVDAIKSDLELSKSNAAHVQIDTVLMDFEMPLLTGPEATQRIRELGYEGKIVGVTGNVLEEDIEFFKEHGANEVFPKPISMDALNSYWHRR